MYCQGTVVCIMFRHHSATFLIFGKNQQGPLLCLDTEAVTFKVLLSASVNVGRACTGLHGCVGQAEPVTAGTCPISM
jgi:hypothetical protein